MQYTAAEMTLRGQHAAYAKWAQVSDRAAATAPARKGWMARFDRQVIADAAARGETLTPAQVARMADSAMRSYMAGLRLKQSLARGRDKAAKTSKAAKAKPELEYVCSWCHPKTGGKSHRTCQRHQHTLDAMLDEVRARHGLPPIYQAATASAA